MLFYSHDLRKWALKLALSEKEDDVKVTKRQKLIPGTRFSADSRRDAEKADVGYSTFQGSLTIKLKR